MDLHLGDIGRRKFIGLVGATGLIPVTKALWIPLTLYDGDERRYVVDGVITSWTLNTERNGMTTFQVQGYANGVPNYLDD